MVMGPLVMCAFAGWLISIPVRNTMRAVGML